MLRRVPMLDFPGIFKTVTEDSQYFLYRYRRLLIRLIKRLKSDNYAMATFPATETYFNSFIGAIMHIFYSLKKQYVI